MENLYKIQKATYNALSSYDKEGGNKDWIDIKPNEKVNIMDYNGCGIIKHIWVTIAEDESELYSLRKTIIRMYWDNEENPSVIAPLGDFFGLGFGIKRPFENFLQSASEDSGRSMNSYFPMPFRKKARIEIENGCNKSIMFYYKIDFEEYRELDESVVYFHAQYNQKKDTQPNQKDKEHLSLSKTENKALPSWYPAKWEKNNLYGEENYVLFEAEGCGHYIGCNLNIDNFNIESNYWYGEGDEMIWIDQDFNTLPKINGTGTEDYFNTAFCPKKEFSSLYNGITLYSGNKVGRPWGGKNSMYRLHIHDPIHFKEKIKFTFETGHANILNLDYSSTAYWYQSEPHKKHSEIVSVKERLPRL
ncbi:MAG: glycoside hydrolase family 172 protein [Lachnospirales bacterium]